MSKILACILFTVASFSGFSQKVYFIYLQSEGEQPFFVRMDEKIHSSSASGYLILSKLRDSTYRFSVGFPRDKWPDQNFTVGISSKDHGYLLKNFGEKGWGLFDLQTLAVQMSASSSANADEKKTGEQKEVSDFTGLLSKAADDPSLTEKPGQETKKEEKKAEQVTTEGKQDLGKDTAVAKPVEVTEQPVVKKEEPKNEEKVQPVAEHENIPVPAATAYKPSLVTKRSESSTTEGFGLVFVDNQGDGRTDTIRLLIPNPVSVVTPQKEEPKVEKKFLEISEDTVKKEEQVVTELSPVVREKTAEKKEWKNPCLATAAESDFFTLRKNMAAAIGDDNMLMEAKKYFTTTCFSTDQVRNLSLLFLTDEGKYKFFDLSYPYVTDLDKFSALQHELKEDYYINRFKAMLRN
jgi:hypothetical protein